MAFITYFQPQGGHAPHRSLRGLGCKCRLVENLSSCPEWWECAVVNRASTGTRELSVWRAVSVQDTCSPSTLQPLFLYRACAGSAVLACGWVLAFSPACISFSVGHISVLFFWFCWYEFDMCRWFIQTGLEECWDIGWWGARLVSAEAGDVDSRPAQERQWTFPGGSVLTGKPRGWVSQCPGLPSPRGLRFHPCVWCFLRCWVSEMDVAVFIHRGPCPCEIVSNRGRCSY